MERLVLKYPLKDVYITQGFGKNALEIYKDLGLVGHSGIDFRAPSGTEILASHDGYVTYAGLDGAGGVTLVIRTDKEYEYNGGKAFYKTVYCHLTPGSFKVKLGDFVKCGQVVALSDNTGLSTAPHLHFALKPIYKGEQDWQWSNAEQTNGYFGAIDPTPFFNTKIIVFKKTIKKGDVGDDVTTLQAFLIRKGFLKMPPNTQLGYYGNITAEAVKKYQISRNITHNNGVQVGPLTLKALNLDYDI